MTKYDDIIEYLIKEKEKSEPFLHVDYFALVEKMLPYIGHPDPFVRDDIVCESLAAVTNHLTSDEIKKLIKMYLSDDYLFYDINNHDQYSVLKRTFTLLQLAYILYLNQEKGVLNPSIVQDIGKAMVQYLEEETVLDGYDDSVGWMHSVAHSADVLGRLFQSKDLEKDVQEALLDLLVFKIQQNQYVYIDGEEERIVQAILKGLKSGVLSNDLVEDFVSKLGRFEHQNTYRDYFKIHLNVKALLGTLYFALINEKQYDDILGSIEKAMHTSNKAVIKKS